MIVPLGVSLFPFASSKKAQVQSTLLNGLVAYWKMDEASGLRLDSSGNGFSLTPNEPFGTLGTQAGRINNAARIQPSISHRLSVPYNVLMSPAAGYSVGCWLNPDNVATRHVAMYLGPLTAAWFTNLCWALMLQEGTGKLWAWQVGAGGGSTPNVVTANAATVGAWNFALIWWDGATLFAQLNGGAVASVAAPSILAVPASSFVVYSMSDFNQTFPGGVDESLIHNRVLTSTERTDLAAGITHPF
jgi:hypothetical protein